MLKPGVIGEKATKFSVQVLGIRRAHPLFFGRLVPVRNICQHREILEAVGERTQARSDPVEPTMVE
jgi:hypothetical protein